jgi:hypothetical protein
MLSRPATNAPACVAPGFAERFVAAEGGQASIEESIKCPARIDTGRGPEPRFERVQIVCNLLGIRLIQYLTTIDSIFIIAAL